MEQLAQPSQVLVTDGSIKIAAARPRQLRTQGGDQFRDGAGSRLVQVAFDYPDSCACQAGTFSQFRNGQTGSNAEGSQALPKRCRVPFDAIQAQDGGTSETRSKSRDGYFALPATERGRPVAGVRPCPLSPVVQPIDGLASNAKHVTDCLKS